MTQSGTATKPKPPTGYSRNKITGELTLKPGYKISAKTGKPYRVHGNFTAGGHAAKDSRGSTADRKARRLWILSPAAGFGGNGTTVPCTHCHKIVDNKSMHIDRKVAGGSYRRNNIQPSCGPCNILRGNAAA